MYQVQFTGKYLSHEKHHTISTFCFCCFFETRSHYSSTPLYSLVHKVGFELRPTCLWSAEGELHTSRVRVEVDKVLSVLQWRSNSGCQMCILTLQAPLPTETSWHPRPKQLLPVVCLFKSYQICAQACIEVGEPLGIGSLPTEGSRNQRPLGSDGESSRLLGHPIG